MGIFLNLVTVFRSKRQLVLVLISFKGSCRNGEASFSSFYLIIFLELFQIEVLARPFLESLTFVVFGVVDVVTLHLVGVFH